MISKLVGCSWIFLMVAMSTLSAMSFPDSSKTFRPYLAGLVVNNASHSAEWYCQNLGFEIIRTMDFPQMDSLRIIFLKLGGFELELVQKRTSFGIAKVVPGYDHDKAPIQGIAKLAFMIHGVREVSDGLRQKGVKILYGPFDDEPFGIRSVIIEDLDGNMLQLSEPLKTVIRRK
jgi:uncharacterized glyoxalase superfamily protein PhnB